VRSPEGASPKIDFLGELKMFKYQNPPLPGPAAAVTSTGCRTPRTWIAFAALALCLGGFTAQAQTDKQPWQGTFTKNFHPNLAGSSRISIDLPLPSPSRLLTLEHIGITIGPMASIYGKVHFCEIESSHPQAPAHEFAENRTRILLPLPVPTGIPKVRAVFDTPIRLYVEGTDSPLRRIFRVSCEVEYFGNDAFTVTAVGYTTPK